MYALATSSLPVHALEAVHHSSPNATNHLPLPMALASIGMCTVGEWRKGEEVVRGTVGLHVRANDVIGVRPCSPLPPRPLTPPLF